MENGTITAELIQITAPILCVCREFRGDYMRSSEFVSEVAGYLDKMEIPYLERQIIGIYFDNPGNTPADELRSWQGVLVEKDYKLDVPFFMYRIEGEYVSVSSSGDPVEIIGKAYEALFRYIYENEIRTQSREGIQIMRMINDQFEIQILMKVA
ncbi:MAG: GyrI-like domain-containing protein [Ignavibacteriaceae bacterium]|nr:GyrI-like domain-containing protein [Ignavibacteriaceae bacterium]